jgi:transcriptional regulator with XRE-family HTH domain
MEPAALIAARKELGLNRTEMAKQLRISRSGYVKLERGERPISGLADVAVGLLLKFDRMVIQAIKENVARSIGVTNA